ncbi:MAG: hypothetical protein CFE44_16840 [Burkholderiales bacterium PBB4]|nr:MAG: hypothetical protein CFE44_16840 [Burkholderiales bacterium PBB4]
MFERISRSWQLIKASWSVLKQDKHLLVFPLISAVAALTGVVAFALPVLGLGALDGMSDAPGSTIPLLTYGLAFGFYISLYFVIFFFNAALVGAAMIRLEGGAPTVADGLRVAQSRFLSILGYAVIAATVGMVLRAVQERVGFLGSIVVSLLGAGWTMATYLVVPTLVASDVGPLEAVKSSATTLKKTWGENVVGQAGMGAGFALIHGVNLLLGVLLVVVFASSQFGPGGTLALVVLSITGTVCMMVLIALVQAALGGIYAAALYRYATLGEASSGFDARAMEQAFAPKR